MGQQLEHQWDETGPFGDGERPKVVEETLAKISSEEFFSEVHDRPVFKATDPWYHSNLGSKVIIKKKTDRKTHGVFTGALSPPGEGALPNDI